MKPLVWSRENDTIPLPFRNSQEDVGLDLFLTAKIKEINGVVFYDTGIRVSIPQGYYLQIYPRSSLAKTGYILANSVGIIDPNYSGTIQVALIKATPEAPELSLPFRAVQAIITPFIPITEIQVSPERIRELHCESKRGEGGFGSTG